MVDNRPHQPPQNIYILAQPARGRRRPGQRIDTLEARAKEAAKGYHDSIKKQKKEH
jgi:hypothetical protein